MLPRTESMISESWSSLAYRASRTFKVLETLCLAVLRRLLRNKDKKTVARKSKRTLRRAPPLIKNASHFIYYNAGVGACLLGGKFFAPAWLLAVCFGQNWAKQRQELRPKARLLLRVGMAGKKAPIEFQWPLQAKKVGSRIKSKRNRPGLPAN